jgi:lysyl-tRNA synthetase class 2
MRFSKNFRNEGMDHTQPEFTAMEIYVYKDYNWMMKFVAEDLLEHCAIAVNGTSSHFWSA